MSVITEHTTVYRTSDGSLFATFGEADEHETTIKVEKAIRKCVDKSEHHAFGRNQIGSPEWKRELVRNLMKEGLAFK